jgi:tight adherence protein B
MSRTYVLGVSVVLFTAVLLLLTTAWQAWLQARRAQRAHAAHRLGLDPDALRASLDVPVREGAALWLQQHLDQAGDGRSIQAFLTHSGLFAVVGLLITVALLHGPMMGSGMVLGFVPLLLLRRTSARRSRQITEQLPDAFDRIGGTLRAGHAFSDAMRIASQEMPEPLAEELGRVVAAQALGMDVRRTLEVFANRNPDNFDIRLFVGAVLLNRETGGNLVEILEHLAETVRERLIFDSKVLSLTAEVRMSAWILGALPFAVGGVLVLIKPTYLQPLLNTVPGQQMLAFGVTSLLIGAIVMRRLSAVES